MAFQTVPVHACLSASARVARRCGCGRGGRRCRSVLGTSGCGLLVGSAGSSHLGSGTGVSGSGPRPSECLGQEGWARGRSGNSADPEGAPSARCLPTVRGAHAHPPGLPWASALTHRPRPAHTHLLSHAGFTQVADPACGSSRRGLPPQRSIQPGSEPPRESPGPQARGDRAL